jgi:class 3 adenylate cyclase
MRFLSESFAARLFTGLLGTVGLLLLVTYLVVRSETATQVQAAAERAAQNAATLFGDVEEIRRQNAARVAAHLTEGRRMLAALDQAVEGGDISDLIGEAGYEADLAGLPELLIAFTDARARPIFTLHGSDLMEGQDPADMGPPARELLDGQDFEVRSYRVLDGSLFSFRTQVIELGGRPIGTVSLGLPIPDEEVSQIGRMVGVEACVVVDGRCVVGSPRASELGGLQLADKAGLDGGFEWEALGSAWSVRSRPLIDTDPSQGSWVIAVPLDPVRAPFNRIARALLLGGGLALLLAVVVGVMLSRSLTRPVKALVAATGRVAEGDYEAEVPVMTRDELGTLAAAFNDMTRGLLLKERLRSILDVVSSREVAEELVSGGLELGGENRQVTVLFADIRGFSTLTEGMEPQKVITLLNECMQHLSEAVVAQGGHVDKFVGDELMAVFNAPREVEDHAGRALRAAVGMQRAMDALNAERSRRGEEPLSVGVGVNTGLVVAGKMGSETRNNYTVLGDTVNLASRLCSGAGPGQVLATRACVSEARARVTAHALGGRAFKGFSDQVDVLSVEAVEERLPGPQSEASARVGITTGVVVLLAALALGMALAPEPGEAQRIPSLTDLGAEFISPSGAFQVSLSGQADIEVLSFRPERFGLAESADSRFLGAPRVRLFTDVFVGDAVYALVELRGDRGEAPTSGVWDARVDQAFVRVLALGGAVSLQVGRFATPFGSYAQRHLTDQDPFVRPPLIYDYRTMMCPGIAPPGTSAFLTWQDRPDEFRSLGAPPIWGVPYQWGAMVAGARGPLSYRVAAMNSAPSSAPEAWGWDGERMQHPSWVTGLGLALSPSLSVGVSVNHGPWLDEIVMGTLPGAGQGGPAGASRAPTRWDYAQTMVAVDAAFARGPLLVRAEVVRDQWQVPNMPQAPVEFGASVEAQADLVAGFFAAARFGALDFRPVDDGPTRRDWDFDARRYEASLGYRLDRNAGLLAGWSRTPARSPLEGAEHLVAARFWVSF